MDYRYFPEPDMPLVSISEQQLSKISQTMKPGPYERIKTYKDAYKFNKEYINALINDVDVNQAFEYGVAQWNPPAEVAKRLVWPIQRRLNEQQVWFDALAFTQKQFLDFLLLIKDGKLANAQAKIVMSEMIAHGTNPEQVIEEKWLKPVDEDQVKNRLDQIFKEKPDLLEDLKSGNMKPMWFVVGQVMKLSWWAADPGMVNGLIRKIIG